MWVDQSHILRAVVAWENGMYSGAWGNNLLDCRVVHFADAVGERSCCIDHTFCTDSELVNFLAIGFVDLIFRNRTVQFSVFVFGEADDFKVVDHSCAEEGCRSC